MVEDDGWLQFVRDGVRAGVDAGLIREPDDIDFVAQGACVGAIAPTWPAGLLDCPEISH